ncbi:conserved hypothetical protein [Talaromyces stipitatus ATCC 10500]|uniref:HTH CENPB-type domain-containing protein n=1 Tax=Talaromyces stipitatus (strain ATCC 10500 / CBS 375.48 / QM 6759 / NRRL 1006) TaxID=441959 RepID=B8MFH8_TALSN|nr:uncharacterized protein TSTA_017860 [Talaromyces stipitatus ATCC 10500]EED16712.1 conserved hypothetical protein [Talaromyces stipitatus ATCC 10500]
MKYQARESLMHDIDSKRGSKKINLSLTAKTFGVNRSTLSRRFRNVTGSKQAQYDNQRLLNDQQSKKLLEWIDMLTGRGLPPTPSMLANFAYR